MIEPRFIELPAGSAPNFKVSLNEETYELKVISAGAAFLQCSFNLP